MAWVGFDNRIFLNEYEKETYKRRAPVRYSSKGFTKSNICEICFLEETNDNPLQVSHKIPFIKGVIEYGFTPDFLDLHSNLMTAHRKICNKKVEYSDSQIKVIVKELKKKNILFFDKNFEIVG